MPEEGRSYEGPSPDTVASLCHPWSMFRSPKNSTSNTNRPIIGPPLSAIRLKPDASGHAYQLSSMNRGCIFLPVWDHRPGERECRDDEGFFQTKIFHTIDAGK